MRIAAKVDPADHDYFDCEIRPLLDNPLVEFMGEIADDEKAAFLGHAKALLFPIDWPEPFGLVMIEAMACGVTGFIVDSVKDAVDAARRIDKIDRYACRERFERRFAARRMASQYIDVYQQLAATRSGKVA